ETSEQWVTDVVLTNEGLEFNALENNAGRNRAVRIYLTLTDAFDNEYLSFADVEQTDRKSTRLNSSHVKISYAVFCLKKKTYLGAALACPAPCRAVARALLRA